MKKVTLLFVIGFLCYVYTYLHLLEAFDEWRERVYYVESELNRRQNHFISDKIRLSGEVLSILGLASSMAELLLESNLNQKQTARMV